MSSPSIALKKPAFEIPKAYIGPLLITSVLIAAHLSFGILDSYQKLFVAIAASFMTEAVLHYAMFGKTRNMSSAYVSGISAGILVRSPLFWPFALCAAISIASKYVLRYKGRHIWNPTNFGIVMLLLLAPESAAVLSIQWGSNMWAMGVIWIIGLLTLWKVKRFHITFVYIISFLVYGYLRSLYTGDAYLAEVALMTGPMYQLFALFMMTDPKTTVSSRNGRIITVIAIATLEAVLRLNELVYAPFYALFIVGPIALIIEDQLGASSGRKEKQAVAGQQAQAAS